MGDELLQDGDQTVGLNIVVQTLSGGEHPTWDVVRRGPDRDIADIVKSLPSIEREDFEGDVMLRPADFEDWRAATPVNEEARDRYLELLCILEDHPQYWVHLSY
jgi:hypothetical protein